jgi:hypothetical protein
MTLDKIILLSETGRQDNKGRNIFVVAPITIYYDNIDAGMPLEIPIDDYRATSKKYDGGFIIYEINRQERQ